MRNAKAPDRRGWSSRPLTLPPQSSIESPVRLSLLSGAHVVIAVTTRPCLSPVALLVSSRSDCLELRFRARPRVASEAAAAAAEAAERQKRGGTAAVDAPQRDGERHADTTQWMDERRRLRRDSRSGKKGID